jgi:hypothetical protein
VNPGEISGDERPITGWQRVKNLDVQFCSHCGGFGYVADEKRGRKESVPCFACSAVTERT